MLEHTYASFFISSFLHSIPLKRVQKKLYFAAHPFFWRVWTFKSPKYENFLLLLPPSPLLIKTYGSLVLGGRFKPVVWSARRDETRGGGETEILDAQSASFAMEEVQPVLRGRKELGWLFLDVQLPLFCEFIMTWHLLLVCLHQAPIIILHMHSEQLGYGLYLQIPNFYKSQCFGQDMSQATAQSENSFFAQTNFNAKKHYLSSREEVQ